MNTPAASPAGAENVLLVHWHDLGRYLGVYGHPDVTSPHLDRLAAEGLLFTRAHATAPLCSPSRGSLFTGRYPQSNGLIGLAHHGWEYRPDVQTLPAMLGQSGWRTALFGMQHETSHPSRLGFDEYDVSNSYCEYVTERASRWLRAAAEHPDGRPFLLTAGFFETHRPYPVERYTPARGPVNVPDYLPDVAEVRDDLADFYGSIRVADAAVGELLATLADTGLNESTWVVFLTDHGPALPRAKSTLYDAGTGIALIVRPPRRRGIAPAVYDELFSGVDLLPTLFEFFGAPVPNGVQGISHAANLLGVAPAARSAVYSTKTYHDCFDPIRAIRTKEFSYIENYAARPELDLPWDISDSAPGRIVEPRARAPRPARELYDLTVDPTERINLLSDAPSVEVENTARDLALRLNDWRQRTGDVIPSEYVGDLLSETATRAYAEANGIPYPSRSAAAAERGISAD